MHADEGFVDDVQPAFGQQTMDVGNAPVGRVFDGQHGDLGLSLSHSLDRVLESRAGQRF